MKKLFAGLLVLCLVVSGTMVFEKQDVKAACNEGFYEISTDDPIWATFETVEEMREAVYLDASIFMDLSTQEVLRAVLEYPLIGDVFAYDNKEVGVRLVSRYCTALRIFLRRNDARQVLRDSRNGIEEIKLSLHTTETNIEVAELIIEILMDYFGMGISVNAFNPKLLIETPNGTEVEVTLYDEYSDEERQRITRLYMRNYPLADVLYEASNRYNCHSFAWYKASCYNIYWMSDPSAYMRDGSYKRAAGLADALKIYYPRDNHSAIPYRLLGGNANMVVSKWSDGPVVIHRLDYCPYNAAGATYWK